VLGSSTFADASSTTCFASAPLPLVLADFAAATVLTPARLADAGTRATAWNVM